MKKYILLIAMLVSVPVYADEYFLMFNESCTMTAGRPFECTEYKERVRIFRDGSQWYGRNPDGGSVWELSVDKVDKNILILNNPVFFSGSSTLYIMRRSGEVYMSEGAYSDILNESEFTVRYGRLLTIN